MHFHIRGHISTIERVLLFFTRHFCFVPCTINLAMDPLRPSAKGTPAIAERGTGLHIQRDWEPKVVPVCMHKTLFHVSYRLSNTMERP